MKRARSLRILALAAATALGFSAAPAREAQTPPFTSLTGDFAAFYDETPEMPETERVAAFRARFNALFSGFYEPRYDNADRYDGQVARALKGFPGIRMRYDAVSSRFPEIFASGIAHFRATFPDFKPDIPIYLVHSLGEMDGGTRTIRGRNVMVFGADVIAAIHGDATIGPFFDHELFHIYHARHYPDCDEMRCALWQEGLATYAAGAMNRTTDPAMLMLTLPAPIIPEVDANKAGALCYMQARLGSTNPADYRLMFNGGSRAATDPFPKRFGYYVGYLVASEAARTMSLARLAKLGRAPANAVVDRSLKALIARAGGCPAT